jgi:chromosome segregation ATPase
LILILLIFLGAFNVIPQFAFLATEGGLSLFGIIVCFILSLIVVLNFAAMVLYAVERKSFRHAQTKKRNDSIVYLEQQLALSHKKITQLYKTSKKSNELIYKKSLIVCKDTTDSTLKKLDQNITEKNAQLDKTVKHKDQEISKLLNQINKLNKQIAQLKNQITHAKEKGVKKTTSYI